MRAAAAPLAEPLTPPAQERLEPVAVLWKRDRHLDLVTRRHTALEGIGSLQYAQYVILHGRRNRLRHFPIHHVVRQISAQSHLRYRLEQLQRREQVVGDAIAV